MRYDWAKWFIYDLKKLIRNTKRQMRHRYFEALNPPQRENLYDTCQDTINALEGIRHNIKSHRYNIARGE